MIDLTKDKRKIRAPLLIMLSLLIIAINLFVLWQTGRIIPNSADAKKYTVKGADISVYQGEIDWNVFSRQGLDFVFIKATEGSSFVDPNFSYNWENAKKTSTTIGAYHFFSFDSSAKTQAENLINTVGELDGQLVPTIDIELYGKYKSNPKSQKEVVEEIQSILDIVENKYGKKPIIYCTQKAHKLYIDGKFDSYPLFIRNVVAYPKQENWDFWQYTDKGTLKGYDGEEKYVDLNVFNGDENELKNLLV